MLLTSEKSLCDIHQKIIVSQDKGSQRKHKGNNTSGFNVRHYKLDGDLIRQQKCCDFLVLNDSLKKAYFIELKGRHINDAVPQLENGMRLCESELQGYTFYYRIVSSKTRTHDVQGNTFRKFKEKCGGRLKCKTNYIEENI